MQTGVQACSEVLAPLQFLLLDVFMFLIYILEYAIQACCPSFKTRAKMIEKPPKGPSLEVGNAPKT